MIGNRRMTWRISMWTQPHGNIHVCHTSSCSSSWTRFFWKTYDPSKNQSSKSVKHLFRTTEKLIKDQKEIAGLSTIDWNQLMWRESSPLCDRAVQIMKSKTCAFSDSVLCLGGISSEPVKACESKIKWFLETRCLEDLDRIDGEHMEFEWTISKDSLHLGMITQNMMAALMCEREQFQGRIIFMSTYNVFLWENQEMKKIV